MATSRTTGRRWGCGGWLVVILFVIPMAAVFSLISVAGLGSGAVLAVQRVSGTVVQGEVIKAVTHTVEGRRAPDERYCYGSFAPAAADGEPVRVRVSIERCLDAAGRSATLVTGIGAPLSRLLVPDTGRVGGPMAFNGLFGMAPTAVVEWAAFWRGLWPFLFLVPLTVGVDLVLVSELRKQRREPTGRGRR